MDTFTSLNLTHQALRQAVQTEEDPARREQFHILEQDAWQRLGNFRAETVFDFAGPVCYVNGSPVPCRSKGLPIAWLVLAAQQYTAGGIRPEWFFEGRDSDRRATEAIKRAAQIVGRYSTSLGGVMASIGIRRGVLVVKTRTANVVCTSSMLESMTFP